MANDAKSFGRLLWYDPNPSDNIPINNEDLSISVELYVNNKSKTIITSDATNGQLNIINSGTDGSQRISFIKGSPYKEKESLTTRYTEIQSLNTLDGSIPEDELEALGIESIDINFNTSWAPVVKIKFIDIRGAAIFSRNGGGKFKFFFEMPFPIFNLTVKGFYGKPVTYCLHMTRFNSSFNSNNGNFEIQADFIGYTYALLSDMLVGLLRAAEDTKDGKAKLNKIKSTYKSPLNASIISINELLVKNWKVGESFERVRQDDTNVKQLKTYDESLVKLDLINTNLRTMIDNFVGKATKYEDKNGYLIIPTANPVDRSKINDEYQKYKDKIKPDVDYLKTNIKISSVVNDITDNNFNTYTSVTNLLVGDATSTTQYEDLKASLKAKGYDDTKITEINDIINKINYGGKVNIDFYDFNRINKTVNNVKTAINNDKAILSAKTNKKVSTNLNQDVSDQSTIRNNFRVFTTAVEVFLELLYDIGERAEKSSARTKELNKLGTQQFDGKQNEGMIYAWPEFSKKKGENGFVESWLGSENIDKSLIPELVFVESLFNNLIEQKKDDLTAQGIIDSSANNETTWYPVSSADVNVKNANGLSMTKNPYASGIKNNKGEEALRVLILRAFLYLGVANNRKLAEDLIRVQGKLEAHNLNNIVQTKSNAQTLVGFINTKSTEDIINLFKDGTSLTISPKKSYFKEDNNKYKYTYIYNENLGRAYIPVSGGFDGKAFYQNYPTLDNTATVYGKRTTYIYVSNVANNTKNYDNGDKNSNGDPISKNNNGLSGKQNIDDEKRSNELRNSGAIFISIISETDYNASGLKPTAGDKIINDKLSSVPAELKKSTIKNSLNEKDRKLGLTEYMNPYLNRYSAIEFNSVDGVPSTAHFYYSSSRGVVMGGTFLRGKFKGDNEGVIFNKQKKTYKYITDTNYDTGIVNKGQTFYNKRQIYYDMFDNQSVDSDSRDNYLKLSNSDTNITAPIIDFNVSIINSVSYTDYYYSLFGSLFYNVQESNYSKAFLFLHSIPWNGVVREGTDIWDNTLFDFHSDNIKEQTSQGSKSNNLEVMGMFKTTSGFIKAPKAWALFIGAVLWRRDFKADPIKWFYKNNNNEVKFSAPFPNSGDKGRNNIYPRTDEFLYYADTYTDNVFRPFGINFSNHVEPWKGFNDANKEEAYAKVDEAILGLPKQARETFIDFFKNWVSTEYINIQKQLEIDLGNDTDKFFKTFKSKWDNVNTKKQNNTISSDDIEPILGANIIDNYMHISPIKNDYEGATECDFYMILRPNTKGMDLVLDLMKSNVYIQNVVPSIWSAPNIKEGLNNSNTYNDILVGKNDLNLFITSFLDEFKSLTKNYVSTQEEKQEQLQIETFGTNNDEVVKLNIYRTCASIYRKWVAGNNNNHLGACSINTSDNDIASLERTDSQNTRMIDSFRFLDRAFMDIGDIFYLNPDKVRGIIRDSSNSSLFDVMNTILTDNNFNFIPLPTFVNYNQPSQLKDMFTPFTYDSADLTGPSFVCVYIGQMSTYLDLGEDSNYPDDGISVEIDSFGNINPKIPEDMISNFDVSTYPYDLNVPVFNVEYGQQNQSYFKDIQLDQKEFTETAESLLIIENLSNNGDKSKTTSMGQNLFNVYQKRSYSCEIETMGNFMIQPMMYFQLSNIPMFRGLYLIINVSHRITPNQATTTFKGVRVKKSKTPLLKSSEIMKNFSNSTPNNGTVSYSEGTSADVGVIALGGDGGNVRSYYELLIKGLPTNTDINGSFINGSLITSAAEQAIVDWNRGKIKESNNLSVLQKYARRTPPHPAESYANNSLGWSAIFSSFIMSEADNKFPKSPSHLNYISAAMNGESGYEAFPLKNGLKIKVEIGDMYCNVNHDHCDVVYKIDGKKGYLIGGNLSDTVLDSVTNNYPYYIDLDNNGYINENGSTYIKNKADNDYHIVLKKTNNKYYNKKKIVNNNGVKTQEQPVTPSVNVNTSARKLKGVKQEVYASNTYAKPYGLTVNTVAAAKSPEYAALMKPWKGYPMPFLYSGTIVPSQQVDSNGVKVNMGELRHMGSNKWKNDGTGTEHTIKLKNVSGAAVSVVDVKIHQDEIESLKQAYKEIINYYGLSKVWDLGLNTTAGTYFPRMNTNDPSQMSMHSFGIAIDILAASNPNTRSRTALFRNPEYKEFLNIMDKNGWFSLGAFTEKKDGTPGYDYMHFQTVPYG